MTYAEVVVHIPLRGQRFPVFHYSIPPHLEDRVAVGQLVLVPFGSRLLGGLVVGLSESSPVAETKPISAIVDPQPVLLPYQIELARWISEYYLAPFNEALALMFPPGFALRAESRVRLCPQKSLPPDLTPPQRALVELLQRRGPLRIAQLRRALGRTEWRTALRQLVRKGLILREPVLIPPRTGPRMVRFVRLLADEAEIARALNRMGRASPGADVLEFLAQNETPLVALPELCERVGCSPAQVRALARKGLVEIVPRRQFIVPALSRQALEDAVRALSARAPKRAAILAHFREHPEPIAVDELLARVGCSSSTLRALEDVGYVERIVQEPMVLLRVEPEQVRELVLEMRGLGRLATVLEFLRREGGPVWVGLLYAETGCTSKDLRRLAEAGLISLERREVWRDSLAGREFALETPPPLTPEQEVVWKEIRAGLRARRHQVYLLHGVTGSGKTEIYLRAIAEVLAQGRQAIVLVPEIALTPQTVRRFAARFRQRLALMHSRLSEGERYDVWRRVRKGEVDIVIGPRSALFVPLPRLGLIVVDEEHERSYKNERRPYYNARDVAVKLGELTGAVVILGSATPDVVSYYRAQRGEYRLLEMPLRIMGHRRILEEQRKRLTLRDIRFKALRELGPRYWDSCYAPLPPVQVVDLRQELKAGNRSIFSRALQEAMAEALSAGQQVILFLNRRGMATFVLCRDCGHVLRCPRCDVPLTYHAGEVKGLLCHHCNRRFPLPELCPVCGGKRIRYFGLGTQRVEEEVRGLFPQARILRWDRDTARRKEAHEFFTEQFSSGQADVLVGTQMIAKGLDLPLVTLVGVISADTALYLPDFRAAERTFQLLTQVAGRAGRSLLGGRVIVQTYTPNHYAIQAASGHDYARFYRQELEFRRRLGYPPFSRLARLLYTHTDRQRCQREARRLAGVLRKRLASLRLRGVGIIGPVPCFYARLRGRYRWQIIVRAPRPQALLAGLSLPPGWRVDVDPVSLL